jgi:aldose 1-epimerase
MSEESGGVRTLPQLAPSGHQWTITHGEHEAVIVEVGGGVRRYQVAGVEVLDGFDEDQICPGGAGTLLTPWPNRIRDGRYRFAGEERQLALTEAARHNAIHGLVNWVRWHVEESAADELTIGHDLPPVPGYPWPLRFAVTWDVSPAGLRCRVAVTNVGSSPCPFGFASHPYLQLSGVAVDDLLLHVPAQARLLVDGRLLPIGAARVAGGEFDYTESRRIGSAELDTAFGDLLRDGSGGSAVDLSTVDGRWLRVWADETFNWWQVFTGDSLTGERHRRSVAIEPMTCPPDAFRSGRDLIVLEPGQTWQGAWGVSSGVS